MKALVVYESMYGNTRHVAEAITEGLRLSIDAELVPVADADDARVAASDLVVVGGPTHAWGMSRRRTRQSSAQPAKGGTVPAGSISVGVREWLRAVEAPQGCRAAAFDTRLDKPAWLTGTAMRGIERGLRAAGFSVFTRAQSFTVVASLGPLSTGELDRARTWGAEIGRRLVDIGEAPTRAA
jgi:hypothetical protein